MDAFSASKSMSTISKALYHFKRSLTLWNTFYSILMLFLNKIAHPVWAAPSREGAKMVLWKHPVKQFFLFCFHESRRSSSRRSNLASNIVASQRPPLNIQRKGTSALSVAFSILRYVISSWSGYPDVKDYITNKAFQRGQGSRLSAKPQNSHG